MAINDSKHNLEELADLLESGNFEARMSLCFRRDGDEEGNLIEDYETFPLDYFEGHQASNEEFKEYGYE